MTTTTKTTKTIKKIVKTPAQSTMTSLVKGLKDFDTLSAAIKMTTSEEELRQLMTSLTPEQYEVIIDYMTEVDSQVAELERQAKEAEERVEHMRSFMLEAMKEKNMTSIVTGNKNLAKVAAGRTVSEFTVTIHEFMQIVQDAGHASDIDRMVSIKKTKAEEFLGKSLVNKITKPIKNAWGKVKFSRI